MGKEISRILSIGSIQKVIFLKRFLFMTESILY